MTYTEYTARVERIAKALAHAHDIEHRDNPLNHGALAAYNAGVDMTIDYWNALARAAIYATDNTESERVSALKQKLRMVISHATGGSFSDIDIDAPLALYRICIEITRVHNRVYQAGKDSVK